MASRQKKKELESEAKRTVDATRTWFFVFRQCAEGTWAVEAHSAARTVRNGSAKVFIPAETMDVLSISLTYGGNAIKVGGRLRSKSTKAQTEIVLPHEKVDWSNFVGISMKTRTIEDLFAKIDRCLEENIEPAVPSRSVLLSQRQRISAKHWRKYSPLLDFIRCSFDESTSWESVLLQILSNSKDPGRFVDLPVDLRFAPAAFDAEVWEESLEANLGSLLHGPIELSGADFDKIAQPMIAASVKIPNQIRVEQLVSFFEENSEVFSRSGSDFAVVGVSAATMIKTKGRRVLLSELDDNEILGHVITKWNNMNARLLFGAESLEARMAADGTLHSISIFVLFLNHAAFDAWTVSISLRLHREFVGPVYVPYIDVVKLAREFTQTDSPFLAIAPKQQLIMSLMERLPLREYKNSDYNPTRAIRSLLQSDLMDPLLTLWERDVVLRPSFLHSLCCTKLPMSYAHEALVNVVRLLDQEPDHRRDPPDDADDDFLEWNDRVVDHSFKEQASLTKDMLYARSSAHNANSMAVCVSIGERMNAWFKAATLVSHAFMVVDELTFNWLESTSAGRDRIDPFAVLSVELGADRSLLLEAVPNLKNMPAYASLYNLSKRSNDISTYLKYHLSVTDAANRKSFLPGFEVRELTEFLRDLRMSHSARMVTTVATSAGGSVGRRMPARETAQNGILDLVLGVNTGTQIAVEGNFSLSTFYGKTIELKRIIPRIFAQLPSTSQSAAVFSIMRRREFRGSAAALRDGMPGSMKLIIVSSSCDTTEASIPLDSDEKILVGPSFDTRAFEQAAGLVDVLGLLFEAFIQRNPGSAHRLVLYSAKPDVEIIRIAREVGFLSVTVTVGNKKLSDQELLSLMPSVANQEWDDFDKELQASDSMDVAEEDADLMDDSFPPSNNARVSRTAAPLTSVRNALQASLTHPRGRTFKPRSLPPHDDSRESLLDVPDLEE
eukprot:TRINITY_DN3688_c1_g1_i1.p1 TRINITY_DN3688_c1_g1~~TRINITY_DN3688_c1_g1_i1.p1  ORF type:complete len:952 (+),score=111.22 TRINITY_DN3688_c1_g1_i1:217-3072(+)